MSRSGHLERLGGVVIPARREVDGEVVLSFEVVYRCRPVNGFGETGHHFRETTGDLWLVHLRCVEHQECSLRRLQCQTLLCQPQDGPLCSVSRVNDEPHDVVDSVALQMVGVMTLEVRPAQVASAADIGGHQ